MDMARGPLSRGTVELWTFDLDQPPDQLARLVPLLDEAERHRAGSFVHPEDRRRFVVAHGRLREVLGHYLGRPPHAVPFAIDTHGKPYLAVGGNRLQFNLAHAGEYALIGVGMDTPVGVDLEPLRCLPDRTELARQVLSPQERALLARLPPRRHDEAFLTFWTRKEAVLKACGLGLAVAPATVAVGLRRRQLHDPNLGAWHLRSVTPARGYVGAVAASYKFYCVLCQADAMLARVPPG